MRRVLYVLMLFAALVMTTLIASAGGDQNASPRLQGENTPLGELPEGFPPLFSEVTEEPPATLPPTATTFPFVCSPNSFPQRVNISSTGAQTDLDVDSSITHNGISADGRFIVFTSVADNLAPGITNGWVTDVFLRDRLTCTTTRISQPMDGVNGVDDYRWSSDGGITPDGHWIVFQSGADNLVPGDTNFSEDIFVYERTTGAVERVSIGGASGTEQSDGYSFTAVISNSGRYVAFHSGATNLDPRYSAHETNYVADNIFVRDRQLGITRLVSRTIFQTASNEILSPFHFKFTADESALLFSTSAPNLILNDSTWDWDVFSYNLQTEAIERLTYTYTGAPIDDTSPYPYYGGDAFDISPDGRYLAFKVAANPFGIDIAPNASGTSQLYVRDLQTGAVSVASSNGGELLNGSYPLFLGDSTQLAFLVAFPYPQPSRIFIKNLITGALTDTDIPVEFGDGGSYNYGSSHSYAVSGGQYIATTLSADNVVPDDINMAPDVFIFEWLGGAPLPTPSASPTNTPTLTATPIPTLTRTPTSTATATQFGAATITPTPTRTPTRTGTPTNTPLVTTPTNTPTSTRTPSATPTITPTAGACSLADVIVRASVSTTGSQGGVPASYVSNPIAHDVSDDGRYVLFSSDAQLSPQELPYGTDVYRFDRMTCTTQLVTFNANGLAIGRAIAVGALNASGRYAAYVTLVNLEAMIPGFSGGAVIVDLLTGTLRGIPLSWHSNLTIDLSADGRYLVYAQPPSRFDIFTNVYVQDLQTNVISLVSRSMGGETINGSAWKPQINGTASAIVFISDASNLVPNDTNNVADVFRYEVATGQITRVSVDASGNQANFGSTAAQISDDGRYVAFRSIATNLIPNDTNGVADIFRKDLLTGEVIRVSVDGAGNQASFNAPTFSMSNDGSRISFTSYNALLSEDTFAGADVYVRDMNTNTLTLVTTNGAGFAVGGYEDVISGNGYAVAFNSASTQLPINAADTNGVVDVFLKSLDASSPTPTPTNTQTATNTPSPTATPSVSVIVSRTSMTVSEGGTSVVYNVRLSQSPAAGEAVTITVNFDAGQLVLSPLTRQLNSTNWNTGRNFTVTALNDSVNEVSPLETTITHTTTSSLAGSPFVGVTSGAIAVTVIDDDMSAATATFTATNTDIPPSNTPTATPTDTTAPPTATATDTPTDTPTNTATNTPTNTLAATATATATITPTNTATQPLAYVIVSRTSFSISEGGMSVIYNVRLSQSPVAGETVTVVPNYPISQLSFSPTSRQLNNTNWNTGRNFTVTAIDDSAGEVSPLFVTITHSTGTNIGGSPFGGVVSGQIDVTVIDNDVLAATNTPTATNTATSTASATNTPTVTDTPTNTPSATPTYTGTPCAAGGLVRLVSIRPDGTIEIGYLQASYVNTVSFDGRYVAFSGDTVDFPDPFEAVGAVYLRDMQACSTERIDVSNAGVGGDWYAESPVISDDGRYVAFVAGSNNLVPGDTEWQDIFLRDRQTSLTSQVSVNTAGIPGNGGSGVLGMSSTGRFVTFFSDADNLAPNSSFWDLYQRDTQTNTTAAIRYTASGVPPSGPGGYPFVSTDGRFIALASLADNIVPNDTNDAPDIFVRDMVNNTTQRITMPDGTQINGETWLLDMSSDGRYFLFRTEVSLLPDDTNGNRADVYRYDRVSNTLMLVSAVDTLTTSGTPSIFLSSTGNRMGAISDDGRYAAFISDAPDLIANDTNGTADGFVRDLLTNRTYRVSIAHNGAQLAVGGFGVDSMNISGDGSIVIIEQFDPNVLPISFPEPQKRTYWVDWQDLLALYPQPTPVFTPTPTSTATDTLIPPTATPTETATSTSIPPTVTNSPSPTLTPTSTATTAAPPQIIVSVASFTVSEGGASYTYNVRLSRSPAAGETVTIAVSFDGSQVSLSPLTRQLNSTTWNTGRNFSVTAVDDAAVEGLMNLSISHSATSSLAGSPFNGISGGSISVNVVDND